MKSRVLLGAGAWLLGATSATAGSLYAVGQLGHGLLAVPTKQLSVAVVNADLAREKVPRENVTKAVASPRRSKTRPARHQTARPHPTSRTSTEPARSTSPAPRSDSAIVLTSPDGSAAAVCEPGGAYLVYWSPQPGFEADEVRRGPSAVASVVFGNASGGILMKVACRDGVPVKYLSNAWSGDDGGGDS